MDLLPDSLLYDYTLGVLSCCLSDAAFIHTSHLITVY